MLDTPFYVQLLNLPTSAIEEMSFFFRMSEVSLNTGGGSYSNPSHLDRKAISSNSSLIIDGVFKY